MTEDERAGVQVHTEDESKSQNGNSVVLPFHEAGREGERWESLVTMI